MSFYSVLEYENTDESVRALYDDIFNHLGNEGLVDYFKVLGRYNPDVLRVTWFALKTILIQGELPRPLKELVFVAISNEKECVYCTQVHCAICKMMSIDENTLEQVLAKSKALNPKRVKMAIDFAVKMALKSAEITEQDHQILLDEGLSQGEVFELMALASLVNYSNTLAQGMMINVDHHIEAFLNDGVSHE